MKNIWKYIVGVVVVALFVGYIFFSRQNSSSAPASQTTPPPVVDNTGSSTPPAQTGGTSTSTSGSGSTGATGLYKDGTYTGTAEDAFYGTLQASVVIQGGQIVDVTFPQYPDAPGHTTDVSNMALPQLKQEAITAQSANVNTVSGATQDSQAFQLSLANALAQAKN